VQRQVERHASALAVELLDHVPPQVAAAAYTVDEQHRAARPAGVNAAGGAGSGVYLAAVLVEALSAGESAVAEFLDRLLGASGASPP